MRIALLCPRIRLAGLAAAAFATFTACVPAAQTVPTPSPERPAPSPTATTQMSPGTPTTQQPTETASPPAPTPTATPTIPTETPTPPVTPETPTPLPPVVPSPAPARAACPKLESRLSRLADAPDPAAYAASNRLYYADGRVRVVVELERPDENLPTGYAATVETRQGALVQAMVPVRDLCRLSIESQVRYVRAPIESVR